MLSFCKNFFSRAAHLALLGLSGSPSPDEIKHAYHRAAKLLHPDLVPGSSQRFIKLKEAYQNLLSSKRDQPRQQHYEQEAESQDEGSEDFFDYEFFWKQQSRWKKQKPKSKKPNQQQKLNRRGTNIETVIEVTGIQMEKGCSKTISFKRVEKCKDCLREEGKKCYECKGKGRIFFRQPDFTVEMQCFKCRGTGRPPQKSCSSCNSTGVKLQSREVTVLIPKGSSFGSKLKMQGLGNEGRQQAGDLLVLLQECKREGGKDVDCELAISIAEAVLGTKTKIQGQFGSRTVTVDPGSTCGQVILLEGGGLLGKRGVRGDLRVRLRIQIPKQLSKEERQFYSRQLKKQG